MSTKQDIVEVTASRKVFLILIAKMCKSTRIKRKIENKTFFVLQKLFKNKEILDFILVLLKILILLLTVIN